MAAGQGIKNRLVWITYHTAAEIFLIPYGGTDDFTCNYPEDDIYNDQVSIEVLHNSD